MRLFLTEYYIGDIKYCGNKIEAINLKDARNKAEFLGVSVIGEWIKDIDFNSGACNENFNNN